MDLFENNPLLLEDLKGLEEKPLISFKCKMSFLLVVIYWIFELCFRLVSYLHWDTFQMTEKDSDNEYLYILFLNCSDLLSFFELFFHNKCRNLCSDVEENLVNKIEIKTYIKFIFIFLLDLLARFAYFIFHKIFDIDNEEVSHKFAHDVITLIDIIFRFIFYIFIYKGDRHKHKVCSIISIIIFFAFLIIFDVINISN